MPSPKTQIYDDKISLCTLVQREINRFLIVWMQTILAPAITTLLYYVIFALAFGGMDRQMAGTSFMVFLAPGLIMMSMAQNAFANTSSSLIIAKIQGNIVDIFMAPFSNMEIAVGFLTGGIVRGLAVGLATIAVMFIFSSAIPEIQHPVIAVLYAILGSMMLGALGTIAGIWADRFDNIATITNFIVMPLTFLSGTFYSIKALPQIWQNLSLYNPFFYMINGFRYGFTGISETSVMGGMVILLIVNVILIATILRMLHTGYKIKA